MLRYTIIAIFLFSYVDAHHKIYSPIVEEGRQSFEWRGHFNHDDRVSYNKSHHHVLETEYSWTNFWQSELEFHISDKNETPLDWEKTELQNQIQIFDYKNFAGAIYFSYNFVSEGDKADEIEYKYLNQFHNDYLSFITNFIFEKGVGNKASGSTTFGLSNQLMLKNLLMNIDLGVIGFSEFGEISKFNTFSLQEHLYGIQFETEIDFADFEYELSLGYLHGLTDASTNHMLLWNMEIEF